MLTQFEWLSPNTQPCLPISDGYLSILNHFNPVRMVLSQYSIILTKFEWFSPNTQPVNPARMVLSQYSTMLTQFE